MTIPVDINSLNVEEKLRLMELLWNDLSENCEDILIPAWHRDVLKNREEIVKSNDVILSKAKNLDKIKDCFATLAMTVWGGCHCDEPST